MYNRPVYNNEYIRTKICPYNEDFQSNKKLPKDEYYSHSILLIGSICEVENKHYPQIFLDKFYEKLKSLPSLFKELVQISDCSDDDDNNN